MKALHKKLLPLTLFGIAVTALFSAQPAQAFTMTLEQVGSNVVATGSGAINLTGLTFEFTDVLNAQMQASQGLIQTAGSADVYGGFTGPTSFGSGGLFFPNTSSGDVAAIAGLGGTGTGGELGVPHGY